MPRNIYDVAVIGGGASGLMLAANMDIGYSSGVVLEATSSVGSKLLMSGGGRCNITHAGSIKDFVSAYGEAGPAIRTCLYKHNNLELMKWFENLGLEMTEEDERVFPASMKARDVLDALIGEAAHNMWQIESDAKVCELRQDADGSWEIEIDGRGSVNARYVVVATGGITYPETGSDGSVQEILRRLGLEIRDCRSALAPIYVEDYPYADLAGISIPNVTATISVCDKANPHRGKVVKMSGDMLFTHDGFSGPVILSVSRFAEPGGEIRIKYNKEFAELPKRMQRLLEDRARGDSGDVKTKLLLGFLEEDAFKIAGVSERGMVTAGGVSLDEIDCKSMRCRAFDTMYVIGEALDVDGITGGYNLQMCWSTACTAADDLKERL